MSANVFHSMPGPAFLTWPSRKLKLCTVWDNLAGVNESRAQRLPTMIKAGSGMPATCAGNCSFADANLTKLTDNKLARRCISINFISAATAATVREPLPLRDKPLSFGIGSKSWLSCRYVSEEQGGCESARAILAIGPRRNCAIFGFPRIF